MNKPKIHSSAIRFHAGRTTGWEIWCDSCVGHALRPTYEEALQTAVDHLELERYARDSA